jgi:hypothetical protein
VSQKVQVLLIDDLDGSEATETVTFGLDGALYEIDLTTSLGGWPDGRGGCRAL